MLNALVERIDLKADSTNVDDNERNIIDNLFELTVNEELLAGDELIEAC